MRRTPAHAAAPIRRDGDAADRGGDDWEDGLAYELLANDRRRECVRYLAAGSADARVPAGELADHVTRTLGGERENRRTLHQSVYTSLTQHHLAKLDEHGVVEYDYETKAVSRGSNFGLLTRVLDAAGESAARGSFGALTAAIGLATCANLLFVATAYPQLPAAPMVGVATLNLVPVGLLARTRLADSGGPFDQS